LKIARASSFRGRFRVPGDKSISHRAAILGAMARGETRIRGFSSALDCASTLACLRSLGVDVQRDGDVVRIAGRGPESWRPSAQPLDAGNSGSTLRMLAGALAGRPFRSVLTGDESLQRRPVERVATPLRAMGARAMGTEGRPPLVIEGGRLHGITWDLEIASAQVKTAVLLAGLQAEGTTTVRERVPSRDHTERMLRAFGVPLEQRGGAVSVRGGTPLAAAPVDVPGDASSAAFLVVAGLVRPSSEVRVDGVLLNPGRTAFLDVLRRMGARIETGLDAESPEPVGWIVARSSDLRGTTVGGDEVPALIDEVPALAVAAAHAEGTTTITGAKELRVKESDRIAALALNLRALGARVEELPDGLVVEGRAALRGGAVRSFGDHRIAMAMAIAALSAEGETSIEDAECASVSFPDFWDVLGRGAAGARS
jgi:3-phosphoshikimate 1-carboxyvinyltransferase